MTSKIYRLDVTGHASYWLLNDINTEILRNKILSLTAHRRTIRIGVVSQVIKVQTPPNLIDLSIYAHVNTRG